MEGFGVGDESHFWGLWGTWKNTRDAVDRAEVCFGAQRRAASYPLHIMRTELWKPSNDFYTSNQIRGTAQCLIA